MALRRIFMQLGIAAGCLAFLVTLWRALGHQGLDIFQASVHAVIAGIVVLLFAVVILGIIEKIGGPSSQ